MLIAAIKRRKTVLKERDARPQTPLDRLLWGETDLEEFLSLDDIDVLISLKRHEELKDPIFSYLSESILNRKLFRSLIQNHPFPDQEFVNIRRSEERRVGNEE